MQVVAEEGSSRYRSPSPRCRVHERWHWPCSLCMEGWWAAVSHPRVVRISHWFWAPTILWPDCTLEKMPWETQESKFCVKRWRTHSVTCRSWGKSNSSQRSLIWEARMGGAPLENVHLLEMKVGTVASASEVVWSSSFMRHTARILYFRFKQPWV